MPFSVETLKRHFVLPASTAEEVEHCGKSYFTSSNTYRIDVEIDGEMCQYLYFEVRGNLLWVVLPYYIRHLSLSEAKQQETVEITNALKNISPSIEVAVVTSELSPLYKKVVEKGVLDLGLDEQVFTMFELTDYNTPRTSTGERGYFKLLP